MKEKKYAKALDAHGDKLAAYGERLHAFVEEMLRDRCSVADAIAVLEKEKLYLYVSAHLDAREEEKALAAVDRLLGAGAL